MTKGKLPSDIRVLDGEYCNRLWLELKTLARVQAKLTTEGIRSPRTGREISRPAIAMAVWRWCCRHPEESFELERKSRAASGEVLTRDMWNLELIAHAMRVFTSAGYLKWIRQHDLEGIAKQYALSIR